MNEQKIVTPSIEVGDVITWKNPNATYGVVTRISENDYAPGKHYWCRKWYKDKECTILDGDDCETYLRGSIAILVRKGIHNIPVASQQISAYDQPTDFKVGDKVYCLIHGPGVVEDIKLPGNYEVSVKFENDAENDAGNDAYTKDGKFYTDALRTLFFSKPDVLGGGRLTPAVSEETQKAIDLLKQQGYTISED